MIDSLIPNTNLQDRQIGVMLALDQLFTNHRGVDWASDSLF